MIIPNYWAEGTVQQQLGRKNVTIRRFGWSLISQTDAQNNANARAADALQRIVSGEGLFKREPKHPYNGAEGVPIREEIVEQYGETIITRNSYGARCLNTPNVFFADVDFNEETSCNLTLGIIFLLSVFALFSAWWSGSVLVGIVLLVLAIPAGNLLAWAIHRSIVHSEGGSEEIALDRIKQFVERNPGWSLRVYRTPLGIRTIATHQLFSPKDPMVDICFKEIAADPRYATMCQRQDCFRARVSPKPWRIGMERRIGGGVWPIAEHLIQNRIHWVNDYEKISQAFASCAFIESIGSGAMIREVREVVELHDRLCKSNSNLPIS